MQLITTDSHVHLVIKAGSVIGTKYLSPVFKWSGQLHSPSVYQKYYLGEKFKCAIFREKRKKKTLKIYIKSINWRCF